jgi:hypothetical protein
MGSAEDKPRGFAVSDRRVFTPGGEPREGSEADNAETEPKPEGEFSAVPTVTGGTAADFSANPTVPGGSAVPRPVDAGAASGEHRLPPLDFSTFVLSLGSSALMHLGDLENPGTGTASKNLPMAKHSIDILSMLQEKTKGNLNTTETQLLENLLYDLRLRYVTAAKGK